MNFDDWVEILGYANAEAMYDDNEWEESRNFDDCLTEEDYE